MGKRISPETAKAVNELFRAEAAGLLRYACTLPNVSRSDAEDLVQGKYSVIGWDGMVQARPC